MLPYVLSRIFRPTVLQVFQIDNVELGLCFSTYGFVAILSYIFGGPIADKYSPRKLMSLGLLLTSMGGIIYAQFPSFYGLKILYGYWGFTSVFLFWAPMIKATRFWGKSFTQVKAFGFLEGGRGLVGAFIGSVWVLVFAYFTGISNSITPNIDENRNAFKYVILLSSAVVAFVGFLVWKFLKLDQEIERSVVIEKISINKIKKVLFLPSVWLLMVIVMCAYVGYKVTDVFSLYALDVMRYNQVESAKVASFLLYLRPLIAISIASFSWHFKNTNLIVISFAITFMGALLFSFGIITYSKMFLFLSSIFTLAIGVYSLRALYFSVMKKGAIPLPLTGTAVGIISLIGYSPDIFIGPLMGYFLDKYEGILGHQYVFALLSVFSLVGFFTAKKYHTMYG
tara:strand:- start:298 stop:1485 length:1188 start_codon:yes stop_codon:yes gene_type:complete